MKEYNVVHRFHKQFLEQPYVFFLIFSFFLMLFFTQSSPLFVLNQWVDSNAFFTVGKGMVNGLVPYRDLFEQKGPFLYSLHALAYILSQSTFFGVYIIESIAMFINLVFSFKICRLYLNWLSSVIIALFFPLFILNQTAFRLGDSAEEFAIPFLMILLFITLKHFTISPDFLFKRLEYLLNGVMVGCVFWIKYTLVGPWIGFYMAILLICLKKGTWGELFKAVIFTFSGLVLSSIPWFIYFGMNHAIKDLFNVYIKFNLVTYSMQTNFIGKIINCAIIFGNALNDNNENKVMIIIGVISFMFSRRYFKNIGQKFLFLSIILFLILGVYYGGRKYPYYFLIVAPLSLFGLISICDVFKHINKSTQLNFLKRKWFVVFGVAVISTFLCFGYNSNIQDSKLFIKEPLAQQKFAKLMNQEPNPTLLNYGFLDGGFYLTANIIPNVRYFERQNIDYILYPENMDEQNRYIKEGKVQFIVLRVKTVTRPDQLRVPFLNNRYHLISQHNQKVGEDFFKFLLYKRVN
ncbi:hypothetical protein [Neobacillus mesonae]|uniref:hypothetical protein n=1 Tax=Neobacillus mesonae TaxID=1193713 RepID=UPI002573C2CE|nr:hypothetical protein [Neobacillus mesonae]